MYVFLIKSVFSLIVLFHIDELILISYDFFFILLMYYNACMTINMQTDSVFRCYISLGQAYYLEVDRILWQ